MPASAPRSAAPIRSALLTSCSSSMTESEARPAAMAAALEPNVESWTSTRSIEEYSLWKIQSLASVAPTGTKPPDSALATVTMSGPASSCW